MKKTPRWFRELELRYATRHILDNPECWRAWELTMGPLGGFSWETQYTNDGELIFVSMAIPPQGRKRNDDLRHAQEK